jgi:VIT1/CCC1 family predicted Fe2+/Mn2+ transporter
MKNERMLDLEQRLYGHEFIHSIAYARIAATEKNLEIRRLLKRLAADEKRHMRIWSDTICSRGSDPRRPHLVAARVLAFTSLRRVFGISVMVKFLERSEDETFGKYIKLVSRHREKSLRVKASGMAEKEKVHEGIILSLIQKHEGSLEHIRSVIFGLNDGLVEVLAAVAGLAAFSPSHVFVVVGSIIVAISGTLSMSGGAYLASKSENIVNDGMAAREGAHERSERLHKLAMKDAYYTGRYYFLGALIPILPFLLGATGYAGIAISAALAAIALTIASTVIAVVSNTGIKARITEMLAISFGATAVTMLIGTASRMLLGTYI